VKRFQLKRSQQIVVAVLAAVLAAIVYGLLQLIDPVPIAPIARSTQPVQCTERALLVASDADMVATAYADAKLDRVPGIEDALTAIELPLNPQKPIVSSIRVSNSVMSWPQIIAVSPDGQRAYVAEVRSRPADGIQEFQTNIEEMPAGESITVVDIANPAQPQVIESVNVGRNPEHISISPDGQFLAVNLEERGHELLIIRLQPDGRLGQRSYFPLSSSGERRDNRAAIWHPSGQYLAMSQDRNRSIGFYQIESQPDGALSVEPYGQPLDVGNHLSNPRFSADGHFLLVPDLKWSTKPGQALSYLMNPKGEMIAIRFEPETNQPPAIVSRATVGLSPEGFALSPDNFLIATVNMRRTYFPDRLPPVWRGKSHSSLSLVQFDPQSGQLRTLDEYGFEGLLPEQATFDAAGKSLAVVIYNYREDSPRTGAIEFWHVISGNRPRLERTGLTLDVVRGAHDIVLVPSVSAG
jgi:6-phosphogluconolactonase (cycloisomerase 2 family)